MQQPVWQEELRQSVTDTDELCRILSLSARTITADTVPSEYPLRVPRPFIKLMKPGNARDPLLLQVLPQNAENVRTGGFSQDPLQENANSGTGCILHKYPGRSLILVSNRCGVHCRFCFRRYTLRQNQFFPAAGFDTGTQLEPIRQDTSIEEIIFSGGDPLILEDEILHDLLQAAVKIKHVQRIRIHSRLPVVLPNRLTPELAEILTLPKPLYLVLHVNHPDELSADLLDRREYLVKPVLLSQTVLLKGINDDTETLARLFTQLSNHRILPYYLHQLDRVAGAAHFEVSPADGCRILRELRHKLPGYAVPVYVRECCGLPSKEIVNF
jgi:EF-P beta-lysylation protein EpmB